MPWHLSAPPWRDLPPVLLLLAFFWNMARPAAGETDGSIASLLEPIRVQNNLPALAGAIFTTDGLVEMGTVGVRRKGSDVRATSNDLWHLGSDTKAMTATLAGTFVTEGKLSWDDKIASFFPEIAQEAPESMRQITVAQVLEHRAGLKENLPWQVLAKEGSLPEQRLAAVRQALTEPAFTPGEFHYSNTDYVVIGAILEKISGRPWEELMRARIFSPLKMTSTGFQGTGTPGEIDQPWPHQIDGSPTPENGPMIDNPEIVGPAGTVHCSMESWSRFLVDQLRGAAGMPALFPSAIYERLRTPWPGGDYAFGWIVTKRPWANGLALTHAGSNTMNVAICWLAPNKKFGVLVCCNQGGTEKACDEAVGALIRRFNQTKPE